MSSFSFNNRDIQLITQGAYGCIFKPGMNCKGGMEEEGYITKIQFDKETSKNEEDIGDHLLNNNVSSLDFHRRFAPILDSCPIIVGDIKKDFIEKCDFIRNNSFQDVFYSNKIRYVGKYTVNDYFVMFFKETNKSSFLATFFETHLYLLDSLHFLTKKNVIHFDLKENNILMDEVYFVPIIIDFGLSIRKDQLEKTTDYPIKFFQYYDKYPPWCLEIVLISFIVHEINVYSISGGLKVPSMAIKKDWSSKKVKLEDLLAIIDQFFKASYLIQMITSERVKTVYKKKWKTWIRKFYPKNKSTSIITQAISAKTLVEEIMKSWNTWDTFSLSVIYFRMAQKFMPNHFVSYRSLLVKNILSIPPNRENPVQFSNKLSTLLSKIDLSEKKKWISSLV